MERAGEVDDERLRHQNYALSATPLSVSVATTLVAHVKAD
jgi:hypothetical protein